MYIATALHFGVRDSLTFDDRQRTLATATGLRVRP
jgi:hypothetical protein